jgi:hypothetical protein
VEASIEEFCKVLQTFATKRLERRLCIARVSLRFASKSAELSGIRGLWSSIEKCSFSLLTRAREQKE